MSDSHSTGHSSNNLAGLINLLFIAAVLSYVVTQLIAQKSSSVFTQARLQPCQMDQAGYLRGELFGALQQSLSWNGQYMLCDGMPRPDGGFRLVFSEHANAADSGLRIVLGLSAANPGRDGELVANVTLIDQDNGLFFSTLGLERCWAHLTERIQIGDRANEWRINGQLYCVGTLAAVEGPASVTLGDFEFSGRLTE